jgi:hypothetical protein
VFERETKSCSLFGAHATQSAEAPKHGRVVRSKAERLAHGRLALRLTQNTPRRRRGAPAALAQTVGRAVARQQPPAAVGNRKCSSDRPGSEQPWSVMPGPRSTAAVAVAVGAESSARPGQPLLAPPRRPAGRRALRGGRADVLASEAGGAAAAPWSRTQPRRPAALRFAYVRRL